MPVLHAIVLGVVQGISEFLPISSSGHLHLTRWFLGWDELSGSAALSFDVAVHVGTLVGAAAYLRRDIVRLVSAVLAPVTGRGPLSSDGRIGLYLAVSAVPVAVIGLMFSDVLAGSIRIAVVAACLVVFGLLLGWADRTPARRAIEDFSLSSALVMGVAQALALQPGVSRSGATITAARFLGFNRDDTTRLAFLMSLPVVAGAGVYGLVGLSVPSDLWPALAWGAAASAVTGWAAVWVTVRVASRIGFGPFVFYRVAIGLAVLTAIAAGWR